MKLNSTEMRLLSKALEAYAIKLEEEARDSRGKLIYTDIGSDIMALFNKILENNKEEEVDGQENII